MIPSQIMHTCVSAIVPSYSYVRGELVADEPEGSEFQAAVLPISNEDLRYAPEGTYTTDSKKVYTNGFELNVGQKFTDLFDNQTYTVTTELTHSPIHPLKRYIVIKSGVADVRAD